MREVERRRPTEMARMFFSTAANAAFPGIMRNNGIESKELANVLHKIAAGLEEMATGLRATYILLEEVRELVRRQNDQMSHPSSGSVMQTAGRILSGK